MEVGLNLRWKDKNTGIGRETKTKEANELCLLLGVPEVGSDRSRWFKMQWLENTGLESLGTIGGCKPKEGRTGISMCKGTYSDHRGYQKLANGRRQNRGIAIWCHHRKITRNIPYHTMIEYFSK